MPVTLYFTMWFFPFRTDIQKEPFRMENICANHTTEKKCCYNSWLKYFFTIIIFIIIIFMYSFTFFFFSNNKWSATFINIFNSTYKQRKNKMKIYNYHFEKMTYLNTSKPMFSFSYETFWFKCDYPMLSNVKW